MKSLLPPGLKEVRLRSLLVCLFAFCAQLQAAQLAIIIDDVGYNRPLGERAARLPGAYTLSLLPYTPHSQRLAELASGQGKELMLHAPMASLAGLELGPGALTLEMNRPQFISRLRDAIAQFPGIKGINNHMGSALTREFQPMGWVMSEARRAHLYFIDSRTTAASVAYRTAQAYGLPSASRDVFLDHQKQKAHIRQQLQSAITLARTTGRAIAIGHPYPETLDVLEHITDQWLAEQGVELVPASRLVTRRRPGNGYCIAPPPLLRQWTVQNALTRVVFGDRLPEISEFGYQRVL